MESANLVRDIFKHWKMPYMINEINALLGEERNYYSSQYNTLCQPQYMTDAEYERSERYEKNNKDFLMSARYQKNIEYYKSTYTKILEICDKAAELFHSEHGKRIPSIMENYLSAKQKSESMDSSKFIRGIHWSIKTSSFVNSLLRDYSKLEDWGRFGMFKLKTKIPPLDAESVIRYMMEKCDTKIRNFDSNFNEISFKKDTLLAMQTIQKFSSENNISNNDTLELFCEYIGKPFFHDVEKNEW